MPEPGKNDGTAPVLLWLRDDLRLSDNPALAEAARSGRPVLPLFVLVTPCENEPGRGAASLWWLHHSLQAFAKELKARGAGLVLRRGAPETIVPAIARETGAATVLWNRRYGPAAARDAKIADTLKAHGFEVNETQGNLLHDPDALTTKGGTPFRVFTPFWRALSAEGPGRDTVRAPSRLDGFAYRGTADQLSDWGLLPTKPDWAGGLRETWEPGEEGAEKALRRFVESRLDGYADGRDRPDRDLTSRLSPHLHFGELSPLRVWQAVERTGGGRDAEKFLSELAWREFCHHLLHHFPTLGHENYNSRFDAFGWETDEDALAAWQRGRTGYPIVDAGMRQLWRTGWMHNRVRMIAASFLIKDLMIDWRVGAAWFWDTLVDADPANNSAGWQWVAGSGADAAPYFRVFNPVTQGERFDPRGEYVRAWVPEVKDLPDSAIHQPWTASAEVLARAGVTLGETYPRPIVDHARARRRALAAFDALPD